MEVLQNGHSQMAHIEKCLPAYVPHETMAGEGASLFVKECCATTNLNEKSVGLFKQISVN